MLELEEKKEALLELANAWYNGEEFNPISDLEFDTLENEIKEIDPDWDYREHLDSQGNDVPHYYPMQKVAKIQEKERSMQEVFDDLVEDPDCDNSPKYDGGGLCLYYDTGKIYDGLTRSSTKSGKRQFSKILSMVPNEIDDHDIVAIECEAVCSLDKGHGDLSRQAATGLLNSNSLQERCENEVTIIAFKVRYKDGSEKEPEWVQGTKNLPTLSNGKNITFMPTPFNQGEYKGNKFIWDGLTFLIDGIVEYRDGKSLAHKLYYNEKKVSRIKKIEWNFTESSLKYVPKYIYDTVNVDGTDCSRATAGGTAQLKKMTCGVGAEVEIIKAGLTIPQVLRRTSQKVSYKYIKYISDNTKPFPYKKELVFYGDHYEMQAHFGAFNKFTDKKLVKFKEEFKHYLPSGLDFKGLTDAQILKKETDNIFRRLMNFLIPQSIFNGSPDYSTPFFCRCGQKLDMSDDLNGGLYCSNNRCIVSLETLEKQIEETGMNIQDFIFDFPKLYIEKYLKIPRFGGWKKLRKEYAECAGEVTMALKDPNLRPYDTMDKYFDLSGIQKNILRKLSPLFQHFLKERIEKELQKEEQLPVE